MAKKVDSNCPVTRGEVDLDWYAERDEAWRELGLASPARRALVNAELFKLADLKKISRKALSELHGMGPSAMKLLDSEMKSAGWNFNN